MYLSKFMQLYIYTNNFVKGKGLKRPCLDATICVFGRNHLRCQEGAESLRGAQALT